MVGWKLIQTIHEIKPRKTPLDTVYQLAQTARLVFRHQPNRRFVLCSFLNGPRIFLVVFDRSGVVCSSGIEIHEHPKLFLHVVLGFTFAEPEVLGFDPTITLKDGDLKGGQIAVGSTQYIIDDVLYVEGVIRGRGTVCYRAHHESEPAVYLVIKDSWIDTSREEREFEILRKLDDVPGIPKLVNHCTFYIDGNPNSGSVTTARFRSQFLLRSYLSQDSTAVYYTWGNKDYANIEIREQHRIVTNPFGMRLEDFPSLIAFVRAIRDIAIGELSSPSFPFVHDVNVISYHEPPVIRVLNQRGYVHRDISLRNILLYFYLGQLRGLLIDLEYAVRNNRVGSDTVGNRTVCI